MRSWGITEGLCFWNVRFSVPTETSVAPPCTQPPPYLIGDFVIVEELLVTRKLHGFTLDDDEINPFNRIFEEFRPACDLRVVPIRRSKCMIESLQCLKGSDHFLARCKIGCGCLLPDFNCQRIIWIIKGHHRLVASDPGSAARPCGRGWSGGSIQESAAGQPDRTANSTAGKPCHETECQNQQVNDCLHHQGEAHGE